MEWPLQDNAARQSSKRRMLVFTGREWLWYLDLSFLFKCLQQLFQFLTESRYAHAQHYNNYVNAARSKDVYQILH